MQRRALSRPNLTLLALAALAAALALPTAAQAAALHHAPNHRITRSTSSNWSGYAATGGPFTSVSSSWTQPTATCASGETSYSSFWVGLDGYSSSTVEQTGTDADCSSGTPTYYAWYEMYPKFPVNLSNPVRPGDKITASVTTDGAGSFTLAVSDATAGWTFTTNQRLKHAKLSSAEIIAEAPSGSGGVLPLTNFGTVAFSGATANGQAIGTFNPDPITMASGGVTKAVPSSLSGGTSFSVAWKHS